jgi:DNA-binding CsgD family transcriptional regulator
LLLAQIGDPQDALPLARAVAEIDRTAGGELFDSAQALILLGKALMRAGNLLEAEQVIGEVEASLNPMDRYPYLRSHVCELKGLLHRAKGDYQPAHDWLDAAEQSFLTCFNKSDRARCQRQAAEVLLAGFPQDGRDEAVARLREARSLSEASGASAEKNRIDALLRPLGVRPRAGRPRKTEKGELSPREAEVAVLVAAGVTNSDIGSELFLSERTVQDHISNALRKLGLTGRAALAAWAARQGLV